MKTRENGEGSIRLRADGRYESRISVYDYETGKMKRQSVYSKTKEEAVQKLQEYSILARNKPQYMTAQICLGEWLMKYLEIYAKPSVRRSTWESYAGYAKNHFNPAMGMVRLQDITPMFLQKFYLSLQSEKGLSPKTIHNMNNFLHKALNQAMREGYILSNPASCLQLPNVQKTEIDAMSCDEQQRLMSVSYQHTYGVFIRLALVTGMRIGEICGLQWSDIDFRSGYLMVRHTLKRLYRQQSSVQLSTLTELVLQAPKTPHAIRSIYLLPQIREELREWRSTQLLAKEQIGEMYLDSDFVLTAPTGGALEPRTLYDFLQQMLSAAGVRHYRFHDLRHTFATRAFEQGKEAKTVSQILGHASVSFTLDTYTHVLKPQHQKEMELMSSVLVSVPYEEPEGEDNFL